MNKVIILKGVSGTGKSTYAKKLIDANGGIICSADDYHGYYPNGVYTWTPEVCTAAHKYCKQKFVNSIARYFSLVVVDNTNLKQSKGWGFYDELARLMDYTVEFVEFIPKTISCEQLAARNSHGLSPNKIFQMLQAWQELPSNIEAEVTRIFV